MTPEDKFQAIVGAEPPSGELSGPTGLLERVARRALAKRPEARYGSAEEMLRDLRIVEHRVDPDLVSTRLRRLGPSPRLRRLLPRLAITILVAAAVVAAALTAVPVARSRSLPVSAVTGAPNDRAASTKVSSLTASVWLRMTRKYWGM